MSQNCYKTQFIITLLVILLAAGTMTTGIQVHTTLAGSLPLNTKGTYESGKEAVCFEYTLISNPSTKILAFGATFEANIQDEKAEIGKPLRYGICAKKGNLNPIILETE